MSRRSPAWRSVIVVGLVLSSLLVGSARADDDDKDDNGKPETLAEKAADRFPQPVVVGTLIHHAVLQPLESQPILGHVKQIVRAADGTIKVVVDYGGFFGFGARPIAVPVDAMVVSGQFMEIVEFTPDQLDKFPTYKDGTDTPLAPDATVRVPLAKPSH